MLIAAARKSQEAAEAQRALDNVSDKYQKTLEAGKQALIDRAKALGMNEKQAKALADQIYQIPTKSEWEMIADTSQALSTIQNFMSKSGTLSGKII
mgnify:CR=1 FL=1